MKGKESNQVKNFLQIFVALKLLTTRISSVQKSVFCFNEKICVSFCEYLRNALNHYSFIFIVTIVLLDGCHKNLQNEFFYQWISLNMSLIYLLYKIVSLHFFQFFNQKQSYFLYFVPVNMIVLIYFKSFKNKDFKFVQNFYQFLLTQIVLISMNQFFRKISHQNIIDINSFLH